MKKSSPPDHYPSSSDWWPLSTSSSFCHLWGGGSYMYAKETNKNKGFLCQSCLWHPWHKSVWSASCQLFALTSTTLFHCALQDGFVARPDERETCPYDYSLHLFTISGGLRVVRLPAGSWYRLSHWQQWITIMISVWGVQYLVVASHFHGSYSALHLQLWVWCEGPWFTSIQEGAH